MWHIYHICQEIVSIHKVSFIFIESLSCRPIDLRTDEHNELRKATKKISGPAPKAFPPPPTSLVATFFGLFSS